MVGRHEQYAPRHAMQQSTTRILLGALALTSLGAIAWVVERGQGDPHSPTPSGDESPVDPSTARASSSNSRVPDGQVEQDASHDAEDAELLLEELSACIQRQDSACCERLIDTWFSDPTEGVERLLVHLDSIGSQQESEALALLLHAAMTLAQMAPEGFAPWEPHAILSNAIATLDATSFSSDTLLRGLQSFGAFASSSDMGTVLTTWSGGDGVTHKKDADQIAQMNLATAWIQDMPPEQVEALRTEHLQTDVTEYAKRGFTSRLLIERDIASGLATLDQTLMEAQAQWGPDHPFTHASAQQMSVWVKTAFGPGRPAERAELVLELESRPEMLSDVIDALPPAEAASVLAELPAGSEQQSLARDLLTIFASPKVGAEDMNRVTSSPNYSKLNESVRARLALNGAEAGHLDAARDALAPAPLQDQAQAKRYFAMLSKVSAKIEDRATVEAVIVPWIIASSHSADPLREKLLADLRKRFPELSWLE